jgi:phosphoribosyl-AMP cyclohydrolase
VPVSAHSARQPLGPSAASESRRGSAQNRPVETSDDPTAVGAVPGASQMRWDEGGLVPVVVQDATSLAVLMVAWMDQEALRRTVATSRATYWSRSRSAYWVKGETSGHVQHVREVRIDCDLDTILLLVDQHGPACHTGKRSCFDGTAVLTASR